MNSYNVYENLYANTKANFTIVKDNKEYTLGEYMLMKANRKNLPAEKGAANGGVVSAIFSYVNDKLTVKNPPAKDKTIRRFPFKTTAAAFLSAMMVCTLVLSFGLFSGKSSVGTAPIVSETEVTEIEENLLKTQEK